LTGAIGCSDVEWLDGPALARTIRAGFEPGDAAVLAQTPPPHIPLAAAGPSLAASAIRSYRHGDWASVSSTILLPRKGAAMGALARVLVPSRAGERRSLTVFFQPISRTSAERSTSRAGMSAAMAAEMRRKVGQVERAKDRNAEELVRRTDEKLERGRALVRVSTAVSITVPSHWNVGEYGRQLDASIRLAGFTPLPLDGAHDAAFAAATIPLGTGLPLYRR
jgi:hypothetical protein